jgi:hypothetical protein
MYGLYQRYYAGLAKAGVQLITQFDSMGGTTWGLSEWQDQDPKTAPKLQVSAQTCLIVLIWDGHYHGDGNLTSCDDYISTARLSAGDEHAQTHV